MNSIVIFIIDKYSTSTAVLGALTMHMKYCAHAGATVYLWDYDHCMKAVPKEYQVLNGNESVARVLKSQNGVGKSFLFYPNVVIFLKLAILRLMFKRTKSIVWFQGLIPEESFLRNKSFSRKAVLSLIERWSITACDSRVFVSEKMRDFYRSKYQCLIEPNIVVPCIPDLEDATDEIGLSKRDTVVYLGGMAEWQKIDLVLRCFTQIATLMPDARFVVATYEQEAFEKICKQIGNEFILPPIEVTTIRSKNDLKNLLLSAKFGFLMRDQDPINYVASPIKFLEYCYMGVIPIISDHIGDFSAFLKSIGIDVIDTKRGLSVAEAVKTDISPTALSFHARQRFNFLGCASLYKSMLST